MTDPQRILLIRPSALGDVARTVPALASLKNHWPLAQIDWLVNDTFIDAVQHHPSLSHVIPFPRKRFGKALTRPKVLRELLKFLRQLRSTQYDAVYDLQGLSRSGLMAWVTRSPHRAGPADAREMAWLGYNHRVAINDAIPHTVDRMLGILQADQIPPIKDMRLYTGEQERQFAAQWLEDRSIEIEQYVVIAPTAAWASKCWPIERYDQIIDRLHDFGIEHCIIVGGPGDQSRTATLTDIARQSKVKRHDLVGKTSVGQLMAIIANSQLVIANDSASLHLAMGFGRRTVGIFGPTDPKRVGPYMETTGLVAAKTTRPVNYRNISTDETIIRTIDVDEVVAAVERVLASPPPRVIF